MKDFDRKALTVPIFGGETPATPMLIKSFGDNQRARAQTVLRHSIGVRVLNQNHLAMKIVQVALSVNTVDGRICLLRLAPGIPLQTLSRSRFLPTIKVKCECSGS